MGRLGGLTSLITHAAESVKPTIKGIDRLRVPQTVQVIAAGKPSRSVLLVEETTALRTLLASALETRGFKVTACATANDAIKAFSKADPLRISR